MEAQHAHDSDQAPVADTRAAVEHDAEILYFVQQALRKHEVFRALPTPLDISVADGLVAICGYVRGSIQRREAITITAEIPGVCGVDASQLYADNELEVAASTALAHDPATTGHINMRVRAMLGEVTVIGHTLTPAEREAATRVVATVPGVRKVS